MKLLMASTFIGVAAKQSLQNWSSTEAEWGRWMSNIQRLNMFTRQHFTVHMVRCQIKHENSSDLNAGL